MLDLMHEMLPLCLINATKKDDAASSLITKSPTHAKNMHKKFNIVIISAFLIYLVKVLTFKYVLCYARAHGTNARQPLLQRCSHNSCGASIY